MGKNDFLRRLEQRVTLAIESEELVSREAKAKKMSRIIDIILEQFIESVPLNLKEGTAINVETKMFIVKRKDYKYVFSFGKISYEVGVNWKDVTNFLDDLCKELSAVAERKVEYSWENLKKGNNFKFSFIY